MTDGEIAANEGVITIEVKDGRVRAVYGLPVGLDYRVRDYDSCSECGKVEPLCDDCREDLEPHDLP